MPLSWEFTLFEKNRGRSVNKEKISSDNLGCWGVGRRAGPGRRGRTGPNWDEGRTEPLRSGLGRVGCWAERAVGCWTGPLDPGRIAGLIRWTFTGWAHELGCWTTCVQPENHGRPD
ncbi:hypothetical protein CRG98_039608 [Punica granatum]|uniref:Uncharacterized protein n=1 Tax=Punica granatum TaxID=22663 RepID=A0A2I0I7G9_PUNGR|nr:hypothetical protein CRG98_039608 [Punica granatum]